MNNLITEGYTDSYYFWESLIRLIWYNKLIVINSIFVINNLNNSIYVY